MSFQCIPYVSSTELLHSKWDGDSTSEREKCYVWLFIHHFTPFDIRLRNSISVRVCVWCDILCMIWSGKWAIRAGNIAYMCVNVTVKQTAIRMILNLCDIKHVSLCDTNDKVPTNLFHLLAQMCVKWILLHFCMTMVIDITFVLASSMALSRFWSCFYWTNVFTASKTIHINWIIIRFYIKKTKPFNMTADVS